MIEEGYTGYTLLQSDYMTNLWLSSSTRDTIVFKEKLHAENNNTG